MDRMPIFQHFVDSKLWDWVSNPWLIVLAAHSAYFFAIVVNQWTTALCCKARKCSIFKQGLFTNAFLLVALGITTVIRNVQSHIHTKTKLCKKNKPGTAEVGAPLEEWRVINMLTDAVVKIFIKITVPDTHTRKSENSKPIFEIFLTGSLRVSKNPSEGESLISSHPYGKP